MQVAVKLVGGLWWNSVSNQFNGSDPDYTYFSVVNSTNPNPNTWTESVPGGFQNALVTGNSYRFVSRAIDNAGNPEFGPLNSNVPASVGLTILYDSATVISSISYPMNGGFYQGINSLSGTARRYADRIRREPNQRCHREWRVRLLEWSHLHRRLFNLLLSLANGRFCRQLQRHLDLQHAWCLQYQPTFPCVCTRHRSSRKYSSGSQLYFRRYHLRCGCHHAHLHHHISV